MGYKYRGLQQYPQLLIPILADPAPSRRDAAARAAEQVGQTLAKAMEEKVEER
jgi:hypothetical protein